MLRRGISSKLIIKYASKNGIDINATNVSKHRTRHSKLTKSEIEIKTRESRAQEAARFGFSKRSKTIVSANKCLEDIITTAYDRMATGEVKPTIDNALKAIELQARLKETGMLENSIITFMLEFTREGVPSNNLIQPKNIPLEIEAQEITTVPNPSPQPESVSVPVPQSQQYMPEAELVV
jgi:hypothetical protein